MYQKYFVYVDDGENVFKVAVAAVSEEAAKAWCSGNGEIIAVRDVTEDYPISADKVRDALNKSGFGKVEQDFIVRALTEFEIAE